MNPFPSDVLFEEIAHSVFRIQVSWGENTGHSATGFIVAIEDDGAIVATAKHVVDGLPTDRDIEWVFESHGTNLWGSITRRIEFRTKPGTRISSHWLKEGDFAFIWVPGTKPNGERFIKEGEKPLRVINQDYRLATGSRVGWAGFPGIVEDHMGGPTLCYFEGVVAAAIDRDRRLFYLVDGHSSFGVSGGPLWDFDEERRQYRIAGIMSGYRHGGELPGYCVFEAINPIIIRLKSTEFADRNLVFDEQSKPSTG